MTTVEHEGWLLDIFADPQGGLIWWWIGADGRRLRLRQPFQVTFYVSGSAARLHTLAQYLHQQPETPILERVQRHDLFREQPLDVLAVRLNSAPRMDELFRRVSAGFPDLTYYDADIPIALRCAAQTDVFPLAHCRFTAEGDTLLSVQTLDTRWELDPEPVPLRVLQIIPDVNPAHATPGYFDIHSNRFDCRLPLQPERALLINLRAMLEQHDPDVLLTDWGDTWLIPHLMKLSKKWSIPLPLNREPLRDVATRSSRSYFSYGQIIYRGEQALLFGRWHIDRCNAIMWGDYEMDGVLELARVTSMPVQTSARTSPGTGISAMQIQTALRLGVMVPWHKQQAEDPKSAYDLFYADQGGLVYQPLVGVHRDVAEVDFISMYPSIMVHFNISPETVGEQRPNTRQVPALGLWINDRQPGLVPQTLDPLLEKRVRIKRRLGALPAWDPRRKTDSARAAAHKWLLVTCFGYLGYKNARFGRIEAHQAVTAYGREVLLQAKEIAEEEGCTILHMYVDGLWVKRSGSRAPQDFQFLLDKIAEQTGLPIALDGIYRWVAFLPSRQGNGVPVANRYFGVFQDGTVKARGIEARRLDTPPLIADMQMEMLNCLAQAPDLDVLPETLPAALAVMRHTWQTLRSGKAPLRDCLITQRVSRTLEEYRSPSPAAVALAQLQAVGKSLRPGQRVRFLFTRGKPGVHAWDLPEPPPIAALDLPHYRVLMLRAAATILYPLGVSEASLDTWLAGEAVPLCLFKDLAKTLRRREPSMLQSN